MRNLCIDIGGTSIKWCIIENNILGEVFSFPTPSSNNKIEIPRKIIEIINNNVVDNVGIATAGQVQDGVVVYAADTILDYTGCNLKREIENATNKNTYVLNDVDGALLGEIDKRDENVVVMLALGTGIGGALSINNNLFYGGHQNPMEIGHMKISDSKEICLCGKSGCLEMEASTNALSKHYYNITSKNKNGKEIMELYLSGDVNASIAYNKIIDALGKAISNLYAILDPNLIIIGGAISEAGDFIAEDIKISSKKYLTDFAYSKVKIEIAKNGNKAPLIGMNNHINNALSN